MSCGCVYVGIDYDYSSHQWTTHPVARKRYVCCECWEAILPKEKYERVKGVRDGDWREYKTCLDCVSIRDQFFCEGYYWSRMWEFLNNHIQDMEGNISSEYLMKLTPKARADVCDAIEEYWEEFDG